MGIDYIAFLILLALFLTAGLLKTHSLSNKFSPAIFFSRIDDLKINSWKTRWTQYPKKFHLVALAFFMIAFIDPHLLFPKTKSSLPPSIQRLPNRGIAIYLALDQSGSMANKVEVSSPKGGREMIPKIELLKQVTRQFIIDHPSDLIGLVSFARVPRVLVPLTLDQKALLKELNKIQIAKKREEDGTGIGYAIFKTANLISATRYFSEELRKEALPPYTINGAAIIVVTDGFQDPNRLDLGNKLRTIELDEAAAFAKSQDMHLYIINIDPSFSTNEFSPHRNQLKAITKETGGGFYMVDSNQDLQAIYSHIDQLEKGTINQEAIAKPFDSQTPENVKYPLYPYFIGLGMISLFLALFLESWILKKIP